MPARKPIVPSASTQGAGAEFENAALKRGAGRFMCPSPSITAPAVGGLFFPLTKVLGMGPDETLSPGLYKKVVHTAATSGSFEEAAKTLKVLAEVSITPKRIHRAALRVGQDLIDDGVAAAAAYQKLPLPAQRKSPGPPPPPVACIQADGGRFQKLPRHPESPPPETWWRESKVGCLMRMDSSVHTEDPTPQVPEAFVDPEQIAKIAREIKGISSELPSPVTSTSGSDEPPRLPPKVISQTVVATSKNATAFGELLAAEAHALGFAAALRKAFVADGSDTNWGIWQRHFSHYTPILDWVHAACYVYGAAIAGMKTIEGWAIYCQWIQWLWEGRVDLILQSLRLRQAEIGEPTSNEPEGSPRQRIADAIRYLTNQQSRMDYARYRRMGLPITSSHIESTIKRVNRRIKGTEKFWDRGADPMLHLIAEHLSPPERLSNYWATRPERLSCQRRYQTTQ